MSAVLRGVINRGLPVFKANTLQKAGVISGPPKNVIPFGEKLALGSVMVTITIAPAAWVLMNIQEYKKRD